MDPSDLDGMSEEEIQQLIDLGIIPDQMSALDRQYKVAEKLRSTPMPEGRNSGRVYTAANPGEIIGSLMQQYAGIKKQKGIEAQQGELLQKQAQSRGDYFRKYAGIMPGITDSVREGNYDVKIPAFDPSSVAPPTLPPQGVTPPPATPQGAAPIKGGVPIAKTGGPTKEDLLRMAMLLRGG